MTRHNSYSLELVRLHNKILCYVQDDNALEIREIAWGFCPANWALHPKFRFRRETASLNPRSAEFFLHNSLKNSFRNTSLPNLFEILGNGNMQRAAGLMHCNRFVKIKMTDRAARASRSN